MTKSDYNKWIKVTTERIDGTVKLTCPLPEHDREIIVSDGKITWCDTFIRDGNECWLYDSGKNIDEIKAWMPLPEPHREEEE